MSYLGIDTDNSNSITLREIHKMFNDNKIDIKMDEVRHIFGKFDEDTDGALSFTEFKNCALSPEADENLIKIMRRIRER